MLKNKNFSVEDAIDSILGEETVGNFGNDNEFFGKKPALTKMDKHVNLQKRKDIAGSIFGSEIQCEEDFEDFEDNNISVTMMDIIMDYPNGISIEDLHDLPLLANNSKRDIMRVLQMLSNKKHVIIENGVVKPTFNEDAEEDSDDMGEIIDDIIDDETKDPLTDTILSVLDNSVSGSVSGLTTKEIIKAVREEKPEFTKPQIIEAIKELMSQDKITKGPVEGTLIINSVDNTEDEEIPTGVIRSAQPSSIQTQENQALTNGETKETLKAKGWKENTPNVFTSPDGKEKFALTAESKNLKLNKIMNTYKDDEFFALCEEVSNEIDKIENGYDMPEDDTTAGLDELQDDAAADETGEEDAYTITLTKSEYDLFKSLAEKVMAAAGEEDGDFDDETDTDEFTSDEATDEEANADLMSGDEDDDVDFDEEDSEEGLDDGGNGVYDGSFSNGAPALSKQTPAYGNARRAPITSKHFNPRGGQAYDGAQNAGAPRMNKQTPEYKSKSGKPVQSKQTSAAGTQKSIFES